MRSTRRYRLRFTPSQLLIIGLQQEKIPFVTEYHFHPTRKWRLDFYVASLLGVEIEGGTWVGGRHVQGQGYEDDCEKYNAALMLGIPVARFTSAQVRRGEAIDYILKYLQQHSTQQAG